MLSGSASPRVYSSGRKWIMRRVRERRELSERAEVHDVRMAAVHHRRGDPLVELERPVPGPFLHVGAVPLAQVVHNVAGADDEDDRND